MKQYFTKLLHVRTAMMLLLTTVLTLTAQPAWAGSVINDDQNEFVPVYGLWTDDYSRSQFVIPEQQMEELTTTALPVSLNGVTFYSSNQSISWGDAEFDVYLAEVDETTFANNELKDWDSLNKVYSGSLSISDSKMVITFNDSYTYDGGNLLVGINQTKSGTYKSCLWLGTEVPGASLGGHGSTISQQNFIPATTFDFSAGAASSVKRPTELAVTYTGGRTATVSWTSNETAFDIEVNGVVTEDVTNPYLMTNLTSGTQYDVRVRAKNGDEYSIWSSTVSFTTQAETDAPFFLETTEVTANTATLNWNSIQDSYNVRYRTADDRKTIYFTPFNTDTEKSGWTYKYAFSGGDDPIYGYEHSENSYLAIGYNTTEEDSIISPELPDYPSGCVLEFYHSRYNSQKANTFQVGYSTTTKDLSEFTWSAPIESGSYYKKYSMVLPDGVKYIAFKTTAEDNDHTIFIDDFGIFNDLSAGNWVEENNVTSPLTIDGLEPDTKYEWRVQGIYNSEPTAWSSSATFTTLATTAPPFDLEATEITAHTATLNWNGIQDGYNVRYRTAEDRVTSYFTSFNTNADRSGWIGAGYIYGGIIDDPIYGYPASENYYLLMGYNTTDDAYLISPELPDYPSGCVLKFNYFTAGSTTTFQVGYSTTTMDLSAFTWSDAISADDNAYSTMFNKVLPDGIKYVAFKTKAEDNSQIVFIDNFGIFVKDIPAGDWVEVNDVPSPLPIDGLTPGIRYEWQVQGFYNSDPTPTEWSSTAFFTTNEYLELANDDSQADADGKNSAIIAAKAGKLADVKLAYRTLYKDGDWNTLCLPFDVSTTTGPLSGDNVEAMVLRLSDSGLSGTTLTLNFDNAPETILAGTPFIVKWDNTGVNITNPVFQSVTIDNSTAAVANMTQTSDDGTVSFKGTYAWQEYTEENQSILLLGEKNTLYWPKPDANSNPSIGACRAYFELSDGQEARQFVMNFDGSETTAVFDLKNNEQIINNTGWYTLDGRKLDSKPTQKGVYINNGHKVVVK